VNAAAGSPPNRPLVVISVLMIFSSGGRLD
jgi:hypothetical protein